MRRAPPGSPSIASPSASAAGAGLHRACTGDRDRDHDHDHDHDRDRDRDRVYRALRVGRTQAFLASTRRRRTDEATRRARVGSPSRLGLT